MHQWEIAVLIILILLIIYHMKNQKEVYTLNQGYIYDQNSAAQACAVLGATLATPDQLNSAYNAKADWCVNGWLSDGSQKYPINTSIGPGCLNAPGIASNPAPLSSANCYGPKPLVLKTGNVAPFNASQYSMYPSVNLVNKAVNKVKNLF